MAKAKGTIIKANEISAIKTKSLTTISKNHNIVLSENNGTPYKGCTWRVVKNPNGGYWMNILNLGKNTAKLKTNFKNGGKANCINMMTGESLGSEFELKSQGVLLVEIGE